MLRFTYLAAGVSWFLAAAPAPAAPATDPAALIVSLEEAWLRGDVEAYLAAWRFTSEEQRKTERDFARTELSADHVQLQIQQRQPTGPAVNRIEAPARYFTIREPRGRMSQAVLTFERGDGGWAVVKREEVSDIDGLIHLSLDPAGYDARGLTLRLPDLEVRMEEGTLFTAPASVGPTVLVFCGKGAVDFHPGPATEQDQLRQYMGKERLVRRIDRFFLRLHPAMFSEWLGSPQPAKDPQAAKRFAAAQDYFEDKASELYALEASLPRSPWWLVPPPGDAAFVFDGPKGPLTYALDAGGPEGLSLFDRANRRQICLYAADGGKARYSDNDRRAADILHHDISLVLDEGNRTLRGEDTLRIALRQPATSIRLRLHQNFAIESVSHAEVGPLLFFRVRGQDTVMVSLGARGTNESEITLGVRYRGALPTAFVEDEALAQFESTIETLPIDEVRVLTNRTAWYPSTGTDDYATARLRIDIPAEQNAVTGGRLVSSRTQGRRRLIEYVQERRGKYIAVAIGRLLEGTPVSNGSVTLNSFAVPRLRSELPRRVEEARNIITYFESLFGPAPYPQLNLALIERETPGGHSPPGMIVLAERPAFHGRALRDDPASFWDQPGFFLAHELAHQWWGHGITGENYHERWLSEGFAQYAAALWVRRSRGEGAFADVLSRMNRWALRMTDEGPISLGYRLGHVRGDPQVFRAIAYNKAALVLHLLRSITGDEAFFGGLKRLQVERRFSAVGTEDVRSALETTSHLSLQEYFDAWIDGTELPSLTLRYANREVEGSRRTEVQLSPANLPGPVPVALDLVSETSRETHRVSLSPGGGSWSFDGPAAIESVEVRSDELPLVRVRREKLKPESR